MAKLSTVAREVWNYVREVFGEMAYARYRDFIEARGGQPMPAGEFYLWREEHKYSRPSRCC